MAPLRTRSRIKIIGVNPYVPVSSSQVARIRRSHRGPLPIRFRLNGSDATWRVNLMPVGDGSYRLYLHGGIRKASALRVGDLVKMEIEFDDEYRGGPQHQMPAWFGAELARNSLAKRGWERLAPSRQKEILRYLAGLKSPEAKERNLQKAVFVLAGGRERFLGRLGNENESANGH
jgi:bacteriocin resistance YdeI/OmpD-like protein/uncharacterized protein DUF1905